MQFLILASLLAIVAVAVPVDQFCPTAKCLNAIHVCFAKECGKTNIQNDPPSAECVKKCNEKVTDAEPRCATCYFVVGPI